MRAGCPMGSNGDHEGPSRRSGARLFLAAVLCVALSATAHAATPLRTVVEDVPGSTAYRYGVRDNRGNSMHTLKIVKSPFGGYLGVYHTVVNSRYFVKVATSVDLLNWTHAANLAVDGSQPTIYPLKRGAALVAYETHAGCPAGNRCLALRHYGTESALLSGAASRALILPRRCRTAPRGRRTSSRPRATWRPSTSASTTSRAAASTAKREARCETSIQQSGPRSRRRP